MITNGSLIKITETPRDAQQGLPYVIPPAKRAAYINALMKVGFDVIDFGSFVSPVTIPQMAQQDEVLRMVDKVPSGPKLMAIVGNKRGGRDAVAQEKVDILGFPYSMSETFLKRNINSTTEKALDTIEYLAEIARQSGKELRIFLSMAFGNPYGDKWDIKEMKKHIGRFIDLGIRTITLSDTIGVATSSSISRIFETMIPSWPETEFGLHIHTKPNDWHDKIKAAWDAGCYSFDGVLNGIGGCPMTGYEMIGNLNTLNLLKFIRENKIPSRINDKALSQAMLIASETYEIEFTQPDLTNRP
ncbi:MAG TPA: hypothetical protein VK212_07705 [Lentimicrobium sp.]|nr:hypothetical protein [Lentimicrobium sp.]